jgi:hypothetical protein
MEKRIKKIMIVTYMISLSLLGSLTGGMTSYAVGPGESKAVQTVAKPTTYNQQSVKALGNWEQQGSTWKFKCLDGSYLTNAWVESLSEVGAYYYLGTDGVMLINSKTPDGYQVDENGIWQNQELNQSIVTSTPTQAKQTEVNGIKLIEDENGNMVPDYSISPEEYQQIKQDLKDHPMQTGDWFNN